MGVSDDSVRIQVTLSKSDKKKVEKIAKDEHRSVSNWVSLLIEKELKK